MNEQHVIAVDASCSCGETIKGAYSGVEVDDWHEAHAAEHEAQQ